METEPPPKHRFEGCGGLQESAGNALGDVLNAAIGVRTLAAIVTVLAALWIRAFVLVVRIKAGGDFSGFDESPIYELPSFWFNIYLGVPLPLLVFAVIMAGVNVEERPRHPLVFWPAFWFAASPWVLHFLV